MVPYCQRRTTLLLSLLLACLTGSGRAEQAVPAGEVHWSFQKITRPAVPNTQDSRYPERSANSIDSFVLAKLEQKGLEPAPLADKVELVRRAYFDLLGLPPSPEQVDAFINDTSADAWAKLIDKLLASDHYGERWARHWLDVARYADSAGFEGDIAYPNAWRYRDYVVRSFNSDKPYDRFVQEQIAADEIWPDNLDLDPKRVYILAEKKKQNLEARLGTGLYGFSSRVAESSLDAQRWHYETLTDWVDTTGSLFLGLTLQCARCHEHKFDPITQEDYFAMQAIFSSSVEVEVPVITLTEIASWQDQYPLILGLHEARRAYQYFRQRTQGRKLTDEEREEEKRLRDKIVNSVMMLADRNPSVPNTPYDPLMRIPKATVLGHDRPELVKPVFLLERGELYRPQQQIHPALPTVLASATDRPKEVDGPFGSRKELALWLTRPDHPLTARVMVNRIWQWHFGQALVPTPNDFGVHGAPPTHPALIDWLATEFMDRGWSIKQMHRLIMASSTYQMTSRFSTAAHQRLDPDNRYVWRMNRRRLEGEALWDAIHSTAGTINPTLGGRPVTPPLAEDEIAALRGKGKWPVSGNPARHTRRGLYVLSLRNFRFPMFDVFDAPVSSVSCPQRDVTTVAPQALFSLNSPTVFRQAKQLADRVVSNHAEADTPASSAQWVEKLWKIALARPIKDVEKAQAIQLLEKLTNAQTDDQIRATLGEAPENLASLPPRQAAALVKLCLAVYNLNEFAFVH